MLGRENARGGAATVILGAPALVLGGGSVLLTAASRVVNSLECRGTTRRGSTVPPLLLLRYRCCYYVTSAAISLIMLLAHAMPMAASRPCRRADGTESVAGAWWGALGLCPSWGWSHRHTCV